ncbi:hypothetical protein OS42_03930 [Dickeya oryzae]
MDGVTQQNASLVAEVATAASSLQAQVTHLQQSIASFRLDNEPQHRLGDNLGTQPRVALVGSR